MVRYVDVPIVMSMEEQRKKLDKAVKAGKLSLKGKEKRLSFGSDIMRVINGLDKFLERHVDELSKYEIEKILHAREDLRMIREE